MKTMNFVENNQDSLDYIQDRDMQSDVEPDIMPNSASGRRWKTLKITSLLRWSGSILIVLSAISFLIQGAENVLPSYRYWVSLAFILLLCACGLICAYSFRETKGARIFFGLAAAFLPVQVSQVSAMIYGYLHGISDHLQTSISWWQYGNMSLSTIGINVVLTGIVSVPVVYGGFSILARKLRYQLGLVYGAANLMLLLPFRDVIWMELLIAGSLFWLRQVDGKMSRDSVMHLPEGIAARVILWIPGLIMVGRSFLYPVSFLLPALLLAFAAIVLMIDIKKATQSKVLIITGEWAGIAAIFCSWLIVVDQLDGNMPFGILLLPFSVVLFMLSEKVDYCARWYRTSASILAAGVCLTTDSSGLYYVSVISIFMGILLASAAIRYREKAPGIAGAICLIIGILFYFEYVVNFYQSSPWLSSTVLGLFVLILASYIENREKKIAQKTKFYYNEIKNWD